MACLRWALPGDASRRSELRRIAGLRSRLRTFAAVAIAAIVALAALPGGLSAAPVDHYVLALSWSPTYCASRDPTREPLQCGLDADRTFIVHGLWPNTADAAPSNCRTRHPAPTRAQVRSVLDIMPSEGLVRYQWKKHGTCSGLTAADYFAAMRAAYERVTIPAGLATIRQSLRVRPAVLREAFERANSGLPADGILIACRGDDLVDVRICLTPSLDFRDCPRAARRRCRAPMLEVDPPR